MEKRTLIAVLLTAVLWVAYFVVFPPQNKTTKKQSEKTADIDSSHKTDPHKNKDSEDSPGQKTNMSKKADLDSNASLNIKTSVRKGGEQAIHLKTDKYDIVFSNKGAAIKKFKYIERDIELTVGKNPYNAKGVFDFSLHLDDSQFLSGNALNETTWKYKQNNNNITFYTDITLDGNPVTIEKVYSFTKDSYSFKLHYVIRNRGRNAISFKNDMVIVSPSDIMGPTLDYENNYNKLSSIYYLDGDFEQNGKNGGGFLMGCGGGSSSKEPLVKETGKIQWAGIMSRYFLIIMIPEEFTGKGIIRDNREKTGFRTGIYVGIDRISAGKEVKKSFKIYIGEKDKPKLASVDKSLIDAADVNKFIQPIRDFVIWCLLMINKPIGNLGWALVIFSLLTKIVFMPLTLKSTESMKKMQQLTPMLNEIKAKYKDKPDVMQKKMMELYKEKGVNPMGGCFPMLLQMPFFFALYSALINSIDLWNAPFIFWIKDLSMPDTVATISGFNLNILPLVMTLSTFLQQKLTTVETGGQQQKMMMMMMPIIFIFIFWTMPSGLVLYWTLQNVFQVAHQVVVNKLPGKKKEN